MTEIDPSVVAPRFDGRLDLHNHQGKYGEHLVQLIVTTAGFQCSKPDDTGDGIDLVISRTHERGEPFRPPNVEVQVKASRSLRSIGENWSYDLEVDHYDYLRTPGSVPRYLVLVDICGTDADKWATFGEDFAAFHRCAYWASLAGRPATSNASSIAVKVPKANRYTPTTVKLHMKEAREEFERVLLRWTS